MKLSFSTRGWPQLSPGELIRAAAENEFAGIELYNLHMKKDWLDRGGPFHRYEIAATMRRLKDRKLNVPCLDSSLDISSSEDVIPSVRLLLELARDAGIPYAAVTAQSDAPERIRECLSVLLPAAAELGRTLLIKTNGIFADTARLRRLMDECACDELAALWDVHHPYRDAGESAADTIRNLGAYVRHVHMRDSDGPDSYCLLGEGDLPLQDMMLALSSVDYDGFISLEWKPDWIEEFSDPEVIFPHFVNYMRRFEDTRGKKKRLYPNFDGSGEMIWKKDELIPLTFGRVLERVAGEFPDQYAFKYTTLDYTRTYAEFSAEVDRFARALISLGVKSGSKVAVWATNVPAWYISFWAAARIGAVLVTVNTAYKIHELEYLLRQSDTHTLIMIESCLDADYRAIIRELCPELAALKPGQPLHARRLPFLRSIITVGFAEAGCLTFEEAMARAETVPPEEVNRMASHVRPDDVVNMQYTSGTTGFPKGVMLTHYNVVNNGKCIGDRMDLSTADRMMIMVPMFHCFGMVLSMTAAMTHGATVCPLPYFSAKAALTCIDQERITCFNGVPTMFIAMFNHPDYRKTDFSHMRTGIMAGAGCPPELMRRAARPDEMNMRGIVSVYGQTECAPGNTMTSWTDPLEMRCGTVGYAFPHVECKIVDPETGRELPNGQSGEFCSRGYNVMKGYYKMPEATRGTVDADGWLHSGDLAERAEDGTFRITGRLKDMIIRGGENIYPKELEEFIFTHPAVQDVQVVGVPDRRYGEEALAAVILKEPGSITEEELRTYITARLARHKVPKYIEFVDSFPMNAAGKVLKYKMREAAARKYRLTGDGSDTAKGAEKC